MANRFFLALMILCVATVAEARTWRMVGGGRAVVGDFQDVKGSDVIIRTNTGGIETIPYAKLTKKDKEVVNSNLISQGRQSDVERLKNGESTDSSKDDKSEGMAGKEGEEGGDEEGSAMRTWTDINGNKLRAELVAVSGVTVQLKTPTGQIQTFPITGFSAADQQFLLTNAASGAAAPGGAIPGSVPGPGMPAPGFPGAAPGSQPGYPAMPNIPGVTPGLPGATPGFPGATPGFPNMPAAGAPGGLPPMDGPAMNPGMTNPSMSMNAGAGMPGAMMGAPGASQPGFSSAPGMTPGMGPGMMPGGTGFEPGVGGPPEQPAMAEPAQFQPPQFQPPEFQPPAAAMPVFENVYKCDNCGAEFSDADGVKIGDACPKCSGGSSFRLRGGAVRGLVALAALGAAGIGWVIKKATGKA
ncbi:MAG: hypothetical protein U0996_19930 [Planctomycetaceae bacterium]